MAEENSRLDPLPTPVQPVPVPETQPSTPPTPTGSINGLAIAALVVGIVATLTGFIPFWGLIVGIAAITLGILGARKATGKGMAIAGIITGGLGALMGLLITSLFIIGLVAGSSAREANQRALESQQNEAQSAVDGKKEFAKGETANFVNRFELKVNSSERNYTLESDRTPAQGKQFVLVNVTVKNISKVSEPISSGRFGVLNNGLKVQPVIASVPDGLQTGKLEPGASLTGNILYEVPSDATDLKLAYEGVVIDRDNKSQRITYTLAF